MPRTKSLLDVKLTVGLLEKMRVYLHFEEREAPHHTHGCDFDEKVTILQDLIANFVTAYNLAYPRFLLKASDMQVSTREGRKLRLSLSVMDTSISDKDDLIVRTIADAIIESTVTNKSIEKPREAKPTNADLSTSLRSSNFDESAKFRAELEKLITEKSYRTAGILCREGLTLYPSESYAFYDGLARIKLANREFDGAIANSSLAVAAAAKAAINTSLLNFTLASALFSSADGCDEADEILEKMLLKKFPSSFPMKFTLDVRALRAECLFNLTQHEAAARIVNEHMQWEGAERHLPTLIAYSRFAIAYKKVEEPVRAMLKAIVIDQNNQTCQEMLAELLSTDMGYAELITQVPLTFASAAAYAFLASAVKECSALSPCVRLLRDATRLRPQSASFALNLAHALEIM